MPEKPPPSTYVIQVGDLVEVCEVGHNAVRLFRVEKDGSLTEIFPPPPVAEVPPVGGS